MANGKSVELNNGFVLLVDKNEQHQITLFLKRTNKGRPIKVVSLPEAKLEDVRVKKEDEKGLTRILFGGYVIALSVVNSTALSISLFLAGGVRNMYAFTSPKGLMIV